jgi:3-oxoadipate enol-lactonase
MPFADLDDVTLYYEITGRPDGPPLLQFGGSLFGRQNFNFVNDFFREHYRLISFDGRGYGRSDAPLEPYSIEERAADGAALLDALGIERAYVHGTSMGGMVALAFAALHSDRLIAAAADCALARCDLYRRQLFRSWRAMSESMTLDDFADALTLQSVNAAFLESPEGATIFENTRAIVGKNSLHTIRAACLAMEEMDLEPVVDRIDRPILFTNGSKDLMTPPRLAPSGFSAVQVAALIPDYAEIREFTEIGHASLLEVPLEAAAVVHDFFQRHPAA